MRTPFYYLDQFSRFPARRKRKNRAKSAERATRFRRAGQHMHLLHIVSYMFPCACTFYMYMFPLDNKHPTPPVRRSTFEMFLNHFWSQSLVARIVFFFRQE